MESGSAGEVQYERKLTLFTFLLAGAVIYHQSKLGDWEVLSLHAVVTLTAIWCLVRPSATDRLLLMLGAHFVSVVADMPLVVNHWLLLAFLELGLFVALGVGWARGEPWVRDRAALYRALAPVHPAGGGPRLRVRGAGEGQCGLPRPGGQLRRRDAGRSDQPGPDRDRHGLPRLGLRSTSRSRSSSRCRSSSRSERRGSRRFSSAAAST